MALYANANWKRTTLGSPIALHSSSTLDELIGQRPILLMGGIHGDEPEGVRLAQDTLNWLKNSHNAGAKLSPWICIPCLNVDGVAKGTRVNGRGVDLNRNYPSKDWSREFSKERYFPGEGPASEIEIQGVVEIITKLQPRLIIHCHSWKPCIVGTGELSKLDAKRLSDSSGYELIDEIGYPTPGSLSRYGWHDRRVPVICIEEQEQLADLASIWPRFAEAMKAIFLDQSMRDGGGR